MHISQNFLISNRYKREEFKMCAFSLTHDFKMNAVVRCEIPKNFVVQSFQAV